MSNTVQSVPRTDSRERPPSPSRDVLFDILGNQRRRHVLAVLVEAGGQSTVRDVTLSVAIREYGVAVDGLDYSQRKRIRTSLYQVHLPRMRDAGAIDYDVGRGTLALTPTSAAFLEYLGRDVSEPASPWPLVYASLGAVGLLAVLLYLVEAVPASLGSLTVAASLSVVTLAVSVLHVLDGR